jgi:hypothetical protein
MGGFSSGDWANVSGRKDTVDLSRVLTIKILRRYGFFLKDKTDVTGLTPMMFFKFALKVWFVVVRQKDWTAYKAKLYM